MDYTLGFIGVAIAIILVVAPPKTQAEIIFWLIVMFVALVYPALHVVRMVLQTRLQWVQAPAAIILVAALASAIGYRVWPPIRRHALSEKERALFEKPLSEQKETREEIQIICTQGDEPACVYAAQFVNFFREAGWKVRSNRAEPVRMNNPTAGIVLFKRGEGKLDPDNWRSGLWSALTPSLIDVRQAFVNIGIEPESATNPELPEGIVSVYFGLEKENENAPTDLTRTMKKLGNQWRGGPVPPLK
ncbi:MAG TPA: hypothetical protein VN025_12035 [Candidatus Dormibacteraeota bacterium]|nr:hypothetical protein [Candidatus Dormibacteraeota bacterium]